MDSNNLEKKAASSLRKFTLGPIARRKSARSIAKRVDEALDLLDKRAHAVSFLPEIVKIQKSAREAQNPNRWKNIDHVRSSAALAIALKLAMRISHQEYIFLIASAAEGVHDGRTFDGMYPEVVILNEKLRLLDLKFGLEHDELDSANSEVEEYAEINRQYEERSSARFHEILKDLSGDAAAIYLSDRTEFDRLRERGRRAFFHKGDTPEALTDTIIRYENEARASASARAYTAATTLLGAALEGLLLLRCLRSRKKALAAACSLPRQKRPAPSNTDKPEKWTFDTLIEVCLLAGWLPKISTTVAEIRPDRLAHLLREMRNYVHPGKVSVERPWIEVTEQDYQSTEAIYTTLYATLVRGRHLKMLQAAANSPLLHAEERSCHQSGSSTMN